MTDMTKATENWLNEKLSDVGLGPVDHEDEFWALMWSHALSGAEWDFETGKPHPKKVIHSDARANMLHAIETLYYGIHVTKL